MARQPFSVLADEYMADIKARKKPATYIAVRYSLLRALKILGSTLRVGEIRKLHLAKIEQSLTRAKYSSTTIKAHDCRRSGRLPLGSEA